MRAAILSIGSELLRGDIVDTNAAFLARELSQLGFEVVRTTAIGDDLDTLSEAFRTSWALADVSVSTGGLGPTGDDLTRQAIGAALGEDVYEDPELVSDVEARFAAMGRRMPPRNRQQALLIPSATAIPNPNGTAPGWLVRRDGRYIVAMPGPPHEMRPMWRDSVMPALERLQPGHYAFAALMTFGLGESAVEERIGDIIAQPDVIVATYAKTNGVQIHITARAGTPDEARRVVIQAESALHERIGDAVFGNDDETLSLVVGRELASRRLTLGVMESVTGGELSTSITNSAGSSDYYLGGIVAYSAETKARYGVDRQTMSRHGLVSPETALAMAAAARSALDADIGLATTGIAGSDAVEGKPPGTCYIAISMNGADDAREIHRPGDRATIKWYVAQCALDLLRRRLTTGRSA